jgi:hypothetical protein
MPLGNVVDNLIRLEKTLAVLYGFFGKTFPDDAVFFRALAREETSHAHVLTTYKNILPIEFQKMDKKALIRTEEEVRRRIEKYETDPPSLEEALSFAYLIENNAGEIHYQSLLECETDSESVRVFQTLNFGDRDHARRINRYLVEHASD